MSTQTLHLEGNLTVATVANLHQQMLEPLTAQSGLTLSFDSEHAMDLTFIQLLLSAEQSFSKQNLTFSLSEPLPASLLRMAKEAGVETTITKLTRG